MQTRTILIEATVEYPDDRQPLTLALANLYREYADWLEAVGPSRVREEGGISLPSGMMKWRYQE